MSLSSSWVGVSSGALEAITSRNATPQRSASAWRGEQSRTLCFRPDTVTDHRPGERESAEGNQGRLGPLPRAVQESPRSLTGLLGAALRTGNRAQAGEHEAPEAPRPLPAAAELIQGVPGEHEPGPARGQPGPRPSPAGLTVQPTWGQEREGKEVSRRRPYPLEGWDWGFQSA